MSTPGFTVVDTTVHRRGAVIALATRRITTPDGAEIERDVVLHPGAVSVVAVDDEGRVVFVRQYRAALDELLLEIPAGKRDVADEPPETTARRELAEEVGLTAQRWELLARFHNSPGFSDEESFVFAASGLDEVPHDRQGPEELAMTVERIALSEVPRLVADGVLSDAKSIIGCLCALERGYGR